MKIRHVVVTRSFAGVERHVCVLANEQSRQGHDVEVWGGRPASMRAQLGTAVRYQPAHSLIPMSLRGLTASPPDILHAHMTKAEIVTLPPSLLRRVPLVATRHFAARRAERHGGAALRAVLGRHIDAQIAISRFVASAIDGPATVVYPGVEIDEQVRAPRRSTVLVVQRLQPEKDTTLALRAFAAGAPRDWSLEVVGGGPERVSLETLARDLGIADRTTFLGFRDDVPALMRSASVLLAPCEVEGLGLSVLEGMSHGLPVVASRAGAHPETVGLAEDAQLFEPGDVQDASAMLARVCAEADLRARYGEQLAQVQRTTFTPQSQAAGTEVVYRQVLA